MGSQFENYHGNIWYNYINLLLFHPFKDLEATLSYDESLLYIGYRQPKAKKEILGP